MEAHMTIDTSTKEGRAKRVEQLVRGYEQTGNKMAIISLIGGSIDSLGDYTPADAGEAPKGAYDE